ncbi:MAG TPA: VCBS repeat-containing protein, partial [Acidimicrobiales bacterium]|nr:VCBS repeat-containing protein [Acidimicrobiales bacterium]
MIRRLQILAVGAASEGTDRRRAVGRKRAAGLAALAVVAAFLGPVAPAHAAETTGSLPAVVTGGTSWTLATSLGGTGPTVGPFPYGTKPLVPVMGDWDGNGSKTPGTFEAGTFKLRNSNSAGPPDVTFAFGDPRGYPVAGDFNGDGSDDVAVFHNGFWQVRHTTGTTLAPFRFGGISAGILPVAGDWDNDGVDGIGTYRGGVWKLRNAARQGPTSIGPFRFWAGTGSAPVVGDWDGDGRDSVGVKRGSTWSVRNTNRAGSADLSFDFGLANDLPLTWRRVKGPVLADVEAGPLGFTEGSPATPVTSTLTVADAASPTLTGATVTITSGYQNGQDVLAFTDQAGITGTFAPATGTLTLSGTATLADYQTALRSVTYANSSGNPSTLGRTVTFQVDDGGPDDNLSNLVTRDIAITADNDA